MARQLSMATRRELKQAVGERYRAAGRWERRQILDEFARVTGYHRKHALRVLNRPFVAQAPRPRGRIYDEGVRQALVMLYEAADRICGKRLRALLPLLIRDTQQELAAVSDSNDQPPARASQDLAAFLDGLATAWQNDHRPPQGRRKAAIKHCWRTRVDPFAHSWP